MNLPRTATCVGIAITWLLSSPVAGDDLRSINREARSVLASKCFACHGPDAAERQADLRLDIRAGVLEGGAIVPGEPQNSELLERITSEDPDLRMPPPDSSEPLTVEQQQLIRRWITGGAKYETHWAYVSPQRPALPKVQNSSWPQNEIDFFVLAELESRELKPSPPADLYTLVRRVHLDLLGLPPTPEVADAFVNDREPRAYDRLVDRLLESRHYGERWARPWLDLARYADTNGYEKDRPRSIWPYRDWVIRSLNADMPFDEFTIEQLAGDMLPDATIQQQIATGFHRNTMLNEEGGIDPLEYRFYAMVDRVATTGTVWMGLTVGCAQCHTHKYDPISHTEYYRLMALLNNADEPDLLLDSGPASSSRKSIEQQIAALEADLPSHFPSGPSKREGQGATTESPAEVFERSFRNWLVRAESTAVDWKTLRPTRMESNLPKLALLADGSVFSSGDITKRDVFDFTFQVNAASAPITALRLEALADPRLPAGGPGRCYYEGRKGDFFLSEVTAEFAGRPIDFGFASHSYGKLTIGNGTAEAANVLDGDGSTGWSTAEREGESHSLVLNLADPIVASGELRLKLVFERHFAASLGRLRWSATSTEREVRARDVPAEIESLLASSVRPRNAQSLAALRTYYSRIASELAPARQPIAELRQQQAKLPTTLVMRERAADNPRLTFRHHRGEFLSVREQVEPGVLAVFGGETADLPTDRLAFAQWLVSDSNPLVGRVTVNRAWQTIFGKGIVRTAGDFGSQGDAPTHPELLDWLATEFTGQGWSQKSLHRLIVTSATYRQSSRVTPLSLRRDPDNRFLSRFPRRRLEAELVRDSLLAASGLLSRKMFGPSVYPPQPTSVAELAYGNVKWTPSVGSDRYRRSLYTFSKRTAPFAAYAVFDAPTGETCVARRNNSNTPLQALTLLNDEMYLEMARKLAFNAMSMKAPRAIAENLFRRLLTRRPREDELTMMMTFQAAQRQRCENGELAAATIVGREAATPDEAAWVMTSRVVMNLDEAIVRE